MYFLLAILGTAAVGWGLSEWIDDDQDEGAEPDTPDPETPDPESPDSGVRYLLDEETGGYVGTGGEGADTLEGPEDSEGADTLDGGAGNDEIILGAGDEGTGGAGNDLFTVTEQGLNNAADKDIEDVDYGQSLITDYDPEEDQIVIEGKATDTEDPVYKLYRCPDGAGYRLALEDAPLQSFVDLPNLTLEEGETFDYVYRMPSGAPDGSAVEKTVTLSPEEYPAGLSFHDWDEAQGDHYALFGTNDDDMMQSGTGDYWTAQNDPDAFNHDPGEITLFSDEATLVDGGDGDDLMWVGKNATVIGGEGADSISMYADPYGGRDGEAAELVDFTSGEDVLRVTYAIDGENADYERALATTRLSYDADTDSTSLTVFDDEVARFEGDRTDLSIGFEVLYWSDTAPSSDYTFDSDGNPIPYEALADMDIVIADEHPSVAYGEESQTPPAAWTTV
ncbi:MAG: hypothetical protein OQK05_00690 [Pseudopelagicola sp.]|nr:hypothetical protein [Pseudopelagicola sp.]